MDFHNSLGSGEKDKCFRQFIILLVYIISFLLIYKVPTRLRIYIHTLVIFYFTCVNIFMYICRYVLLLDFEPYEIFSNKSAVCKTRGREKEKEKRDKYKLSEISKNLFDHELSRIK